MGNQTSTKSQSKNKSLQQFSKIQNPKLDYRSQNNIPYQSSQFNFHSPQRQNQVYPSYPSQIKDLRSSMSGSAVGNNRQSLVLSSNGNSFIQPTKPSSTIQHPSNVRNPSYILPRIQTNSSSLQQTQPQQLAEVKIAVTPEIGLSILQKDKTRKQTKALTIQNKTVQFDELRKDLRVILKKMSQKLIPEFKIDISKMSDTIQLERQAKLKDKNKVLFLLKQKTHYEKVCEKFTDYCDRIKRILLEFRRKDSIQQISPQEISQAHHIKAVIDPLLRNIEGDLPQKGWSVLLEQPTSKLYMNVVNSAVNDPTIIKKLQELEQSLTNPQLNQNIVAQNMLHSTTRRVGSSNEKQKI